jgi:prepilin-type N-terminal cleavage/methylation domain-containing protein
MKRGAFTLMELLVSVALLAIITVFMYGAIASSKLSNEVLGRHSGKEHNRTMIFNLLYRDIFESLYVEATPTKEKHFTLVQMQTFNSIYDINAPYVTYYVDSQTDSLMRLEAARKIELPVKYEDRYAIHADVIMTKVSDFNIYKSIQETAPVDKIKKPNADNESLSSEEDINKTVDANNTKSSYLLYLKAKSLSKPFLFEVVK